MSVPHKSRWKVRGSGGDPQLAVDDLYATSWISSSKNPWLEIDLGEVATLAGLEVYWGHRFAVAHEFRSSLDGEDWAHLCSARHGEGGQDVFAFPPVAARFVRWAHESPEPDQGLEIVEINLYSPKDAMSVR